MHIYRIILLNTILTSCISTNSLDDKHSGNKIIGISEEFFSKKYQHSDPYIAIITDLKKAKTKQEYIGYFCKYIPLLTTIFRTIDHEYRNYSNYYLKPHISHDGRLYVTYNLSENGFLSDLKKSSDKELSDYVQSVMASGDIAPSLIAGTTKWNISAQSTPAKRLLFILHIIIIANKCANGQ